MSFFTGQGDDGSTGILGEGRFSKSDVRFEMLGSLDETSAALGMARAQCSSPGLSEIIMQVQRDLYLMMAELAADEKNANRFRKIDSDKVTWLEGQISRLAETVTIPREFLLPGDHVGSAVLDFARTQVRKAERCVVAFCEQGGTSNGDVVRYLNRLSSLVFLMELAEIQSSGDKGPTLAKQL